MRAVCIKCWDAEALVTLDCDGSGVFHCSNCDEAFDRDEVRGCLEAMRKQWDKLLKWADAYPAEANE